MKEDEKKGLLQTLFYIFQIVLDGISTNWYLRKVCIYIAHVDGR